MEKFVSFGFGQQLWSQSFGQPGDPAVLLVMGAMNQGIFWPDSFCEKLAAQGHYVIRYDHRDTGQSAKCIYAFQPYRLDDLASDALAVLDAHGVQQARIVGLSMGGYIGQLLALRQPQRVTQLVLMSTSADHRPYIAATSGQSTASYALPPPGPALLDYIQATMSNPPTTPDQLERNLLTAWAVTYGGARPLPQAWLQQVLRRANERDPAPMSAFNHALAVGASPDRLQSVHFIQTPTLVIHGRHDVCLPLAHGEYLAANIPGARLRVFDMGHSFMGAWDDEILLAMLGFFGE